ncbi:hypothetical protein PAHAL_7G148500 [Panicum hallii]|uniref:Uncharacterized protein n=1 Tax=Panicum hallii TaxID=206008 RepID=A0A2S3I6N5_9POAL|nr:hypothetical protein PAHAL_7G148500 [Panicum hallii]
MLLDGCFLLEVMRTAAAAAAAGEEDDGCGGAGEYAASDPVFSQHGELYVVPYVRRDMLTIENQLPLLVLQRLVAFLHGASTATDDAINNMELDFVKLSHDAPALSGGGLALHPLDVCHRSLLHGPPRPPRAGPVDEFVPSATELHQAGVRFAASRTRSLHDIHFRRGVLSIPELAVDDTRAHKLQSPMAFEQLHAERRAANEVTAYVFLMDNVIKSAADARRPPEQPRQRQGGGRDVQPDGERGRAGPARPAARRAPRRQRPPRGALARVARQPRAEPRGQPVGDHLPRRRLRPPRPHRRADGLHRAAVLRPEGTDGGRRRHRLAKEL